LTSSASCATHLHSETNANGKANGTSTSALDREVYNIEIGKYITDRLFISYTIGVDHEETSALIRYDLNRRFSITGAVDEYRRRRVGIEARFNF
jgi:translocation and assembly module TamB